MYRNIVLRFSLMVSFLIVCFLSNSFLANGLETHPRRCCKYSYKSDRQDKLCQNSEGCILEDGSSNFTSPSLGICRVLGDSKIDILTAESREQCLLRNFDGDLTSVEEGHLISEMFELRRYLMTSDHPGTDFVGIEVVLPASHDWYVVKFRIFDLLLCPEEGTSEYCSPRCVEIVKDQSDWFNEKKIIYDCEGGFVVSERAAKSIKATTDDTYQLDICFESISDGKRCRSYLFEMGGSNENVILVEKDPLVERKRVVLQMSDTMRHRLNPENGTSKVEIYRISDFLHPDRGESELMQYFDMQKSDEGYQLIDLPDGDYLISILGDESDRISVAKFQLSSDSASKETDGLSVGLTSFLVILAVSGLLAIILFRRYRQVQQSHQVSPNRLLDSGRIKPKNVFIITNVDNRHHINIILDFTKYLKSHCGVGQVYFALDSETGFTTETSHDPWKWAQEVAEKMADNGLLLFVAAPPEHAGISIYKDLPNNQAFISTVHLKKMADENRVAVAHFPYSDPDTLPTLLPTHIRNKPHHLPNEMNSFLCQLLEVKKRELCRCLPVPIVKPEILPHDFDKYKGGKELLESINSLTAKVDLLKAELAHEKSGGGAASTLSRMIDDFEIKQLLRPESKKKSGAKPAGLKIDLESNLCSIKDPEFENRDKSAHPEYESV